MYFGSQSEVDYSCGKLSFRVCLFRLFLNGLSGFCFWGLLMCCARFGGLLVVALIDLLCYCRFAVFFPLLGRA